MSVTKRMQNPNRSRGSRQEAALPYDPLEWQERLAQARAQREETLRRREAQRGRERPEPALLAPLRGDAVVARPARAERVTTPARAESGATPEPPSRPPRRTRPTVVALVAGFAGGAALVAVKDLVWSVSAGDAEVVSRDAAALPGPEMVGLLPDGLAVAGLDEGTLSFPMSDAATDVPVALAAPDDALAVERGRPDRPVGSDGRDATQEDSAAVEAAPADAAGRPANEVDPAAGRGTTATDATRSAAVETAPGVTAGRPADESGFATDGGNAAADAAWSAVSDEPAAGHGRVTAGDGAGSMTETAAAEVAPDADAAADDIAGLVLALPEADRITVAEIAEATLVALQGPGAEAAPAFAGRVVVHAPRSVPRTARDETVAALRDEQWPAEAPRTVPYTISDTHVRFYHEVDRPAAERLAATVGGAARDFTTYRPAPEPGLLEVWMSGRSPPRGGGGTRRPRPPDPLSAIAGFFDRVAVELDKHM